MLILRIFRQHTHFEYDDKNVDPSEASFSLLGWVVRYNNESYHVSGPTLVLCIEKFVKKHNTTGVHHYVLYTITQWYFKQELKLTSHQKNPNWKQALWLALVPLRLITHFCQWRSQRSSWGCGGTHAFPLRSTSVCYRHSAERLWILSQWSLTWSGEGTAAHFWCCTWPLYTPSCNMVAVCLAKHRVPIYDNRTAFTTLDWDWLWKHYVAAQSPVCTQRPMKLLWSCKVADRWAYSSESNLNKGDVDQ